VAEDSNATELTVDYDDEIFFLQRRGGISRYFTEMIEQFHQEPALGIRPRWTFDRTDNEILRTSSWGAKFARQRPMPRPVIRLAGKWRPAHEAVRAWQVGTGPGRKGQLLHATYWAPSRANLEAHQRLAVSVMDLIPEHSHARGFGGPYGGREALLKRASVVFTISDATRDDLLQLYPWIEVPVLTTPLAADTRVFNQAGGTHSSDYPYVLFVGNRGGYKNFEVLVTALADLRARGLDIGLVAAGPPANVQEAAAAHSQLPRDRVDFVEPTDQELAGLYRGAEAFVFPSAMEGFGLPTLEAMACGCPAVISDISVFREVAGKAAIYAQAGSAADLAKALEEVLTSSDRRAQLVAAGLSRAAEFTWARTAALTAAGYRMACDE